MNAKKFELERKRKFCLLRILAQIKLGNTPVEIYKSWNWSREKFYYHLDKLKRAGLIRLKIRSSMNIYELTEQGQNYLRQSNEQVPFSLELHNIAWIYDLTSEPLTKPIKSWFSKGIEHHLLKFANVSIVYDNSTAIFYATKLRGVDSFALQDQASNLVDKVAIQLKDMGFELKNKRLFRKGHFGIIDPVITQTAKTIELKGENYKVDQSEGYGEVEYLTPEGANNYLKAIEGIAKVIPALAENQIKQGEIMDRFSKQLELHLSVLTEMKEALKRLGK